MQVRTSTDHAISVTCKTTVRKSRKNDASRTRSPSEKRAVPQLIGDSERAANGRKRTFEDVREDEGDLREAGLSGQLRLVDTHGGRGADGGGGGQEVR